MIKGLVTFYLLLLNNLRINSEVLGYYNNQLLTSVHQWEFLMLHQRGPQTQECPLYDLEALLTDLMPNLAISGQSPLVSNLLWNLRRQ